jgi:hypothetical protein
LSENQTLAGALGEIADLLETQQASPFRVQAYRQAAQTLRNLSEPIRTIERRGGTEALVAIPTIGHSIAHLIEQSLHDGRLPLLERLRGEATAEKLFTTLPTIGPELAHRIHDYLHVESLPALYQAAMSGQLDEVPGIGKKRASAIRESLAERLRRSETKLTPRFAPTDRSVPIAELLDVDQEYRRLAEADKLPKIAPQKFNPQGLAWLPILHTEREDRHYTALFSNTARAHELGTTRDWVVIYREDDAHHEQWTVITAQFGKLNGCRIVRGREDECLEYYTRRARDEHPTARIHF